MQVFIIVLSYFFPSWNTVAFVSHKVFFLVRVNTFLKVKNKLLIKIQPNHAICYLFFVWLLVRSIIIFKHVHIEAALNINCTRAKCDRFKIDQ